MDSSDQPELYLQISPQGVTLCVLAIISLLVCIPPMVWHSRSGNFPAACLIAWFIIQNFFNFVNPLIWPTDDITSWWDGPGYCDIQAKIIVGAGVGIAGPLVCIFRSLAKVLDTDRSSLIPSKAEKIRNLVFEIVFCVVLPAIVMIIHYVVQERRYLLYSIVGCMPSYHQSWVSTAVGYVWPPVVLTVAVFYCLLVLYRLVKHKRDFSSIVSSNANTTKSRFIRLLLLSLVMLLGSFPVQLHVLYFNLTAFRPWEPYSWDAVHGPNWDFIEKHPMFGEVFFDRWIHVVAGYLLFAFFGFGKDATLMYRSALLKLGFGRFFPSLKHPHLVERSQSSFSARFGSISSKARGFFRKKSSSSGASGVTDSTLAANNLSMEPITGYDSAPRPSVSSAEKALPTAPARNVALYPHLEVWPPSPSESTLAREQSHERRNSSQASTIFNDHEPRRPPRADSWGEKDVRGDNIV